MIEISDVCMGLRGRRTEACSLWFASPLLFHECGRDLAGVHWLVAKHHGLCHGIYACLPCSPAAPIPQGHLGAVAIGFGRLPWSNILSEPWSRSAEVTLFRFICSLADVRVIPLRCEEDTCATLCTQDRDIILSGHL